MDRFKDIHTGKVCYLIGKGPSLDKIDAVLGFLECGVILCINESIHKVEALNPRAPLYVVQQDSQLKDACVPRLETTTHFMRRDKKKDPAPRAVLYDPHELDASVSTQTAIVAIRIAKLMGMKSFTLIGFDSWKENGSLEYGTCIGYSSAKAAKPERFLEEQHLIVKALDGCEYENIFL